MVALNYLDALPPDEAISLLGGRRKKIEARFGEIDAIPGSVRGTHPGIEYLHRFYSAELEWLDEVLNRLSV